MKALHIRDLPLDVVEALKRRAARHHRSLQGELKSILCAIASDEPAEEGVPPLRLNLSDTRDGTTQWRREEIYGDDGR